MSPIIRVVFFLAGPWSKIAVKGICKKIQPRNISKAENHSFYCNSSGNTSKNEEANIIFQFADLIQTSKDIMWIYRKMFQKIVN